MANLDRSKFKAAKVADLKQQKQQAEELKPQGNSTRPGYVDLTEGSNIIKFYPPHPGAKSFIYQKCVHWLPFKEEVEKDGKKTVEIKKKPIFNARVHGTTSRDVIEEYIAAAKRIWQNKLNTTDKNGIIDATQIKEKIDLLYNFKKGQRIAGSYSWVAYAKIKNGNGTNVGRYEVKQVIKNSLDQIAINENADDPMRVDPFSDPTDGYGVEVMYNPKAEKAQDYYITKFYTNKDYFPIKIQLTDQELEAFEKMDSLESMFVDSYSANDFEKAIDGLQIYDEQNGFGVFDDSEFYQICAELADQYPGTNDQQEHKETSPNKEEVQQSSKDPNWVANMDKEIDQELQSQQVEVHQSSVEEVSQDYPSKEMSDEEKQKKLAELKARFKANKK